MLKRIFVSFIVSLVGVIAILFFLGSSVEEVRTEVFISAPANDVWTVLTEFDNWKDWNPTVNSANGSPSVGSKLDITISNEQGKDASNYQPVVIESDAPTSFRWRAKMIADFVFKNDRVFELEERTGGTLLVHKEEFSGLMVPLMWGMLEVFVESTLEKTNQALKTKVESAN